MRLINTPLYAESWNVAFRTLPQGSIFNDKKTEFNVIPNSKKYWAADPMVFEHNNIIYIFAELYDYTLCRGTIGYSVFDGKTFSEWKQIIVEPFHMSYPFVFCLENGVYMLPETSGANKLLLYKAVDFPNKWEQVKVLEDDVKWVDTTIIPNETGFLGYTEEIGECIKDFQLQFDDNLNILEKKIISENSNVLRCGGRLFYYNDYLIKVCQDCREKYGGALFFRFCDKQNCSEQKYIRIDPEHLHFDKTIFLDGMHTYSAVSNMEVIDVKTRRFNIINFVFRIIQKMK